MTNKEIDNWLRGAMGWGAANPYYVYLSAEKVGISKKELNASKRRLGILEFINEASVGKVWVLVQKASVSQGGQK